MGEIFHFAFMRRRVRDGALTMRLRSHVRSAVKTASWRAFAAVDTFGLVWLFSGHDATHSRWHGPYATLPEAREIAHAMTGVLIRSECKCV